MLDSSMFITGLGTATPPQRYTQQECWDALQAAPQFSQLALRSRAILKKVLRGDNGIESRHLALDPLAEALDLRPDVLHARFAKHAPQLCAEAAGRALLEAKLNAADIGAILISTCTGYLCPGLTSYVSERLGLRTDALMLDLVGQGCGAALPNLRTAEALLSAGRAEHVLSICVEVCSAAMYLDDDPGVLISACLFGDAAGAAVLSQRANTSGRTVRWKAAGSVLDSSARELIRFQQKDGMLRNVLTPEVPALAARHAHGVFSRVLADAKVEREQITGWIWHAGGRDVLRALRAQFQLGEDDVRWSAAVLRELGNVSSPFVYHVLQRALAGGAAGGLWWMSSFGAGFSCHGGLLEVGDVVRGA